MESRDLHEALVAAGKSRKEAIVHDCGDEAIFFSARLESLMQVPEAAKIIKHVRDNDGEAAPEAAGVSLRPLDRAHSGRPAEGHSKAP